MVKTLLGRSGRRRSTTRSANDMEQDDKSSSTAVIQYKWMQSPNRSTRSLTSDDADSVVSGDDDHIVIGSFTNNKTTTPTEPFRKADKSEILNRAKAAAERALSNVKTKQESVLNYLTTDAIDVAARTSADATATSSTTSTSPRQAPTSKTTVRFGAVQVNYHEIIMGDSPACSQGVPITIGSALDAEQFGSVEEYEKMRNTAAAKSARKEPSSTRDRMLRQAGYTRRQLEARVNQIYILQQQSSGLDDAQRSTAYPAPKIFASLAWRKKNSGDNNNKAQ